MYFEYEIFVEYMNCKYLFRLDLAFLLLSCLLVNWSFQLLQDFGRKKVGEFYQPYIWYLVYLVFGGQELEIFIFLKFLRESHMMNNKASVWLLNFQTAKEVKNLFIMIRAQNPTPFSIDRKDLS